MLNKHVLGILSAGIGIIATSAINVTPVFAATNQSSLPYPSTSTVSMSLHKASNSSSTSSQSLMQPDVTGDGGTATLTVMESAKELHWLISPTGLIGAWDFSGDITIDVYNPQMKTYVYDDTQYISGAGSGTQTITGNVNINGYPTGLSYEASLSGTATDAFGDEDVVLPGATTSWYFPN